MRTYIIIGLGNFGSTLAKELTVLGNEVIAIDRSMTKVDAIKDLITHAICMDAGEPGALDSLPVKEADSVIVAIGEDVGASVVIVALAKQLKAKRILCRAISEIHNTILQSIGVDLVLRPEQESANRLAAVIDLPSVERAYWSEGGYAVIEEKMPDAWNKRTVGELKKALGKMQLTSIIRPLKVELHPSGQRDVEIITRCSDDTAFMNGDSILIFGRTSDLRNLQL
jgi:trk system potassium uptake protein TrkA